MQSFVYYNPVKLIHGAERLDDVAAAIKSYGDKVLLIFGGESFKKNGYYDVFTNALKKTGLHIYESSGNRIPSLKVVRKNIELCRKENISSVVGIGGGVCMDIAKTTAFGVKQQKDIWDILSYAAEPDTMEHLPVGTVVTFPSSGSDMNGSTQILNDETGESAGLSEVYPNFSWQNPEYMLSISQEALISAQITSFVQLSLGYVGLGISDIAENTSLALMKTILKNLDKAIANPGDIDARSNLMAASAMTVNGITTMGKTNDWVLYPLNAIIMDYTKTTYKPCLTAVFPYWLNMVYDNQTEINRYFHKVFGITLKDRTPKEILQDGLSAIFTLYKKYGIATKLSDIHTIDENQTILHQSLATLDGMQSIYKDLTLEMMENLVSNVIHGL